MSGSSGHTGTFEPPVVATAGTTDVAAPSTSASSASAIPVASPTIPPPTHSIAAVPMMLSAFSSFGMPFTSRPPIALAAALPRRARAG